MLFRMLHFGRERETMSIEKGGMWDAFIRFDVQLWPRVRLLGLMATRPL
jgi:hypothetical protein